MKANYFKVWLTSLLLVLGTLRSNLVLGQTNSWSNPNSGIWKWETNSNWSLSSPPASGQSVFITNIANTLAGSRFRTVEIDAVTVAALGAGITASNLTVSGFGSGSGASHNSLFLNNAGTNVQLYIADSMTITPNGVLNITNSSLFVGHNLYVDNNVLFNGGLIQEFVPGCGFLCFATSANTYIGYNGFGAFTMSGGEWEGGAVQLGTSLSTYGTLTISGGSVTMFTTLFGPPNSLNVINGTVWLKGGSLENNNNPQIGSAGGAGQMTVSNGVWLSDANGYIGVGGGTGTLTIAGGMASFPTCYLGSGANSLGVVWQTGGQLNISELELGADNVGQMTISNGTAYTEVIDVGYHPGSSGTLTVAGGDCEVAGWLYISAAGCTATGNVNVTGGSLNVTNSSHTAFLEVDSGTLTLSGGTLRVDKLILTNSCGHFVQTGGTLVVDGVTNVPGSFQITAIGREGNNMRITWTDAGGHTDVVQVTNGTAGNYTTNFTDLSPQIILTGLGNVTTNFLDVGGATNKPSRYYRVRLVP
jgi:hypothetical protein